MLEIGVRCSAIGRSSITITLEMFCGDVQLTSVELVYVYADAVLRKSVAVPQAWCDVLRGFDGGAVA